MHGYWVLGGWVGRGCLNLPDAHGAAAAPGRPERGRTGSRKQARRRTKGERPLREDKNGKALFSPEESGRWKEARYTEYRADQSVTALGHGKGVGRPEGDWPGLPPPGQPERNRTGSRKRGIRDLRADGNGEESAQKAAENPVIPPLLTQSVIGQQLQNSLGAPGTNGKLLPSHFWFVLGEKSENGCMGGNTGKDLVLGKPETKTRARTRTPGRGAQAEGSEFFLFRKMERATVTWQGNGKNQPRRLPKTR